MIRVLHIIDSVRGGGKERQFVELLKGLAPQKDIACDVALMSDIIEYDEFRRLSVPTHYLLRRSRYDATIFPRLRSLIRALKPDIVHSWNSMCTFYGAPTARLGGAKFVDGSIRNALTSSKLPSLHYLIERMTLPFSSVVVSNTRAGLKTYDIPASKGLCIANGFDPSRISNLGRARALGGEIGITTPHVVGMVGAFSRWKDYETFFAVAERVTGCRDDVTFVAIGDGENLSSYRARFAESQFGRIKMLGRRSDVEDLVRMFSVGVLFSTRGEGLANAIMEYMALGKPVIASRSGGNNELVIEGETGYLVADRGVDAATELVQRLLDDGALARSLGERGRRRILEEFSIEKMVSSYADLYRRLASN